MGPSEHQNRHFKGVIAKFVMLLGLRTIKKPDRLKGAGRHAVRETNKATLTFLFPGAVEADDCEGRAFLEEKAASANLLDPIVRK